MTPAKVRQLAQTIPEAFAAICRQASHRIAMQIKQGDGYHKYTYQHVAQQVHCLANALIRQGLRPGDRVAIVAENRPEWVIAYLAILAAGGTAVSLDIQVQRLLGHQSPLMTQRYAHHYPESLRDGLDRLVSTKLPHSTHTGEISTV